MPTQEAIIIGAGPAGCIAAILLARGGWHVRIIEQHRFPHDKVCGECLSALGFDVLNRSGLCERFVSELSPVQLTESRVYSSNGNELRVPLPQPMWGISRRRMDPWLFAAATNAGTIVEQPARCEQIIEGVRPSVRVRNLESNTIHDLNADFVLLADGRGALLPSRATATNDLGIKAHFKSVSGQRDAIDLFGVDGHDGGVAPIEEGLWNVAFSVPRQKVHEHHGNLDALFAAALTENRPLASRFANAERIGPWLVSPLPRSAVSARWPMNVIPLGNAAAALEPIGGEGMGLAMRSAELAANMLVENHFDAVQLRSQFRHLWQYRSFACRAIAKAVSHRQFANVTLPMLRPIPSKWLMSAMGK